MTTPNQRLNQLLLWKHEAGVEASKLKAEIAKTRIRLERMEEDRRNKLSREMEIKKKLEEDDRNAREKAFREAEIIRKTKKYFELNKYYRKVPDADETMYFGDHRGVNNSWIPHGYGEYHVGDDIIFEGNFIDGVLHGNSVYHFEDGSLW